VAGTFYPAEPERLSSLVAALLAVRACASAGGPESGSVAGLLVSTRRLVYSGAIAALSWALAGEIGPATIVLAGTDHQAWAPAWRVDRRGVADASRRRPIDDGLAPRSPLSARPSPGRRRHLEEHSLEIQLPLLIRACPVARIVPLAVSRGSRATPRPGHARPAPRGGVPRAEHPARGQLGHGPLPPARVCEETDAELLEPLLQLDAEALRAGEARVLLANRPVCVRAVCIDPVRVALTALTEMGAAAASAGSRHLGRRRGRFPSHRGLAAAAFV